MCEERGCLKNKDDEREGNDMKWVGVLAATIAAGFVFLYGWPRLYQKEKKEKVMFIALTFTGWLLGIFLAFFPDMPGPTQLVNTIYSPLSKILIKE